MIILVSSAEILITAMEPFFALLKLFLQVKYLITPAIVSVVRCCIRLRTLRSPDFIYLGLSIELVFLLTSLISIVTGLRSVTDTMDPVLRTNVSFDLVLNIKRNCIINLVSYAFAIGIFPLVQDLYSPYYYLNQNLLPGFQPSGIKPVALPNWEEKMPKFIFPGCSEDKVVGFFYPIKKIKKLFLR